MANGKQHGVRTFFILSILCIGMLAAVIYMLSSGINGGFDWSFQSSTEVSQNNISASSDKQDEVTTSVSKDTMSAPSSSVEKPFSYSQHQACGVKRNVYCVLLDDFNPSSDWQQRIRKTISQYINTELGGGSTSDYLIYFFQNNECYKQKIASRATEMCNIPNGEVAASSWGKIYYEYGEN